MDKLEAARWILKHFARPMDLTFIENSTLGDDPEFIELLARLAEKIAPLLP